MKVKSILGGGYSVNREQLTGNRFCYSQSKRVGSRISFVLQHLLPVTCYMLLVVGCDLFQPADPDYLKKIDAEVAWANAAKLSVTLAFPNEWGSSPNAGMNNCYDVKRTTENPRAGYPFSIEFNSSAAYSLIEWRVYGSASLAGINWQDDPNLLPAWQFSETEAVIPSVDAERFVFTLFITDPVTIIPFCKDMPRIVGTIPTDGSLARGDQAITINFAAQIRPSTVQFIEGDNISIKDDEDNDLKSYYHAPELDEGQRVLKIRALGAGPDNGTKITVTIGNGVRSALGGNPMDADYVFSWTVDNDVKALALKKFDAVFNNNKTISVNWEIDPGDVDPVRISSRARYTRDGFSASPIDAGNNNTISITIDDVPNYYYSHVKSGNAVSNVYQYDISVDIIVDLNVISTIGPLRIWNIPGMNTSLYSDQLEEISSISQLDAVRNNPDLRYVLVNDIELIDNENNNIPWTPIENFSGTFYGNGHTITITCFSETYTGTNYGLFSTVNNGTIRNLTVNYDIPDDKAGGSETKTLAVTNFGGIAATAQGNACFENVLVLGEVNTGGSGSTAYIGGLVGRMTGTTNIQNAYGGLDLIVNTNPGTENSLYIGGITGSMEGTDELNRTGMTEVSVVGDIKVGTATPVDVNNSKDNNSSDGGLFVGGIIGSINQGILGNADYRQGSISVNGNAGSVFTGGAVGATCYVNITGCHSIAGDFIIYKNDAGRTFNVGGFIGFHYEGAIRNSYSENHVAVNAAEDANDTIRVGGFSGVLNSSTENPVEYCYAKGNVSVLGYSFILVGGFVGNTFSGSSFSYCYATGNVSAISRGSTLRAGGFSGSIYNASNCYATGDVFVDKSESSDMSVGGFTGITSGSSQAINTRSVQNCFATGNVIAQRSSISAYYAGGFVGEIPHNREILQNCAALGASLTITGPGNYGLRNAGRIYARIESGATSLNNHAYNDMVVTQGAYGASASDRTTVTLTKGRGAKDGADAHMGIFRDRRFWTNLPPVNSEDPPAPDNSVTFDIAIHGLGFSPTVWDFSTVESKGYPRLRNATGGIMGGQ